MWTVTELVFWNEQAMYIPGWKVSRAQRSASSALASSSSVATASGSKPRPSSSAAGTAACSVAEASCRIPLRPFPFASVPGSPLVARRLHQTAHSPSPRSTL